MLGLSSIASSVLAFITAVAVGMSEGPHSLVPTAGIFITFILDATLLITFLPVLRLARRVRRGDTEQTGLDVSAAGCAWAAAVAAVGLVLAPAAYFRIPCGLVLAAALFGIYRVYTLARTGAGMEEGADGARKHAGAMLRRGLAVGVTRFTIASVVLIPLRLHEQAITCNPAVIAMYQHSVSPHCDVRRAGREGDVSLWLVDCGSVTGPTFGWDEREHTLLQDEKLFERVPRLRSVPPYSTSRPR